MAEATSWFVRASDDAPEKGPYTPKQLARSFEKGLLGAKATARREGGDEWLPLKEAVASLPPKKTRSRRGRANDDHALAGAPRGRGVHPVVWLGVIVGLAGVGLTVTFAATGSNAMWPVALILGGVYVAVRGVIRGPERDYDE